MKSKTRSTFFAKGSDAVTYGLGVRTSFAVFRLATCRLPVGLHNCNNATAKTVSTPAVREANELGCLLSDNQCLMSEEGTNVVCEDAITINEVISGVTTRATGNPQLVCKAGPFSKHAAGSCYQPPQKPWCETNCCGNLMADKSVLGPALLCAVGPLCSRNSARLTPQSASTSPHLRSVVTSPIAPGYQGDAATTVAIPFSTVSVLWHTGAYCQSAMPDCMYRLAGDVGSSNISTAIVGQEAVEAFCGTSFSATLSKTLFGWAQAYIRCTPDSPANITQVSTTHLMAGPIIDGQCLRSGHGSEAGMAYSVGGTAFGSSLQVRKAGLLDKQLTGYCYQQPQTLGALGASGSSESTNCHAAQLPSNAVVLCPAPQGAVLSVSSLSSTLLSPLSASTIPHDLPDKVASPKIRTFRPVVTSSRGPGYQGAAATSVTSATSSVPVLWHTSAYGQITKPDCVYQAYPRLCTSTSTTSADSTATAERCGINKRPEVHEVFEPNLPQPQSYHCNDPATSGAKFVSAAASLLAHISGGSTDCTVQCGAFAKVATEVQVKLCTGKKTHVRGITSWLTGPGVAACTCVQSSVTHGVCLWLAGLWLYGRYVQFDPGGPAVDHGQGVALHTMPFGLSTATVASSPVETARLRHGAYNKCGFS